MTYEESKRRKLKRMIGLRIMNALGMVAWRKEHGEATQKLRWIHPLTPVWFIAIVIFGVLSQGIPETIRDMRYSITHDTVWW